MTREEVKSILHFEAVTDETRNGKWRETCRTAYDAMEKLEKIEEAIGNYGFKRSWEVIKKIQEILEND